MSISSYHTGWQEDIFCVHVDDFAIAATHQHLIDELIAALKAAGYIITEPNNLESFLGIHIVQEGTTLYLSQPGHIDKMVEVAKIDHIKKQVPHILLFWAC